QDIRWTYDEYAHEIDRVARGLLGLGFAKGDRVGIWSPNNAEWALLQYATSRLGIIMVNINPAYRTHELAYALEQSGCRGLVAVPTFKTSDYGAMVTELRPTLPDLEHVIFIGTNDWTELLAAGEGISSDDVAAVEASLHPDDPISIQ
ncbi:MAG: AMP-binding protein, partial [Acidimicrobiales bacterium]